MLNIRKRQSSPGIIVPNLPATTQQWSLATQTRWLEAVRAGQGDQSVASQVTGRGGLGLGFAQVRTADIGLAAFDPANATQVLRATQELHARLAIAAAAGFGSPLLRDAEAFLAEAGCPQLTRNIERGVAQVQRSKEQLNDRIRQRRSTENTLKIANRKLAKYGVQMTVSTAWVSAEAKTDDIPEALIEMLQAHRKPQPTPSKETPAAGERADRIAAWRAYPGEYGLMVNDSGGKLRLLEADGKTIAASMDHSVRGNTLYLGGFSGTANGWTHDLQTAMIAELLGQNPHVDRISVDFMDGTEDYQAYMAKAGGTFQRPGADPDAVLQTPLAKSVLAFNMVRPEITGTGVQEGNKILSDESYVSVTMHLS